MNSKDDRLYISSQSEIKKRGGWGEVELITDNYSPLCVYSLLFAVEMGHHVRASFREQRRGYAILLSL